MSSSKKTKKVSGISVLHQNKNNIEGTITFEELEGERVKVKYEVTGLTDGKHGFHIHESGNLLEDCKSCKGHFNPFNKNHGGPKSKERHVGDLGNITADNNGNVKITLSDNQISLRDKKTNIIGRSVIIHDKEDDLGKGGNEESLKTGNAGARLVCAVIGYKKAYYF